MLHQDKQLNTTEVNQHIRLVGRLINNMADVGRPTIMTPETISKLEEVFSLGGTDEEACFYAGIGKTTLYNYQEEHPEFVERKEALKETPVLKARKTIVDSLANPLTAQWFLERKRKKEFSARTEITGDDGKDLIPDKTAREKADKAITSFINARNAKNTKDRKSA